MNIKLTSAIFAAIPAAAIAAVPLRWTVETSRLTPATFDVVRGESLALEATLNSYGKPLQITGNACLCWQTNGMGSTWWTADATVAETNRIRATWLPTYDAGAAVVHGFLGQTGTNYRAAFSLRFRHGPGATPNELPLPVPTIDCAKVTFLHPEAAPFGGGGGGCDTNAVSGIITNHVTSGYLCTVEEADNTFMKKTGGDFNGTVTFAPLDTSADGIRLIDLYSIKFLVPMNTPTLKGVLQSPELYWDTGNKNLSDYGITNSIPAAPDYTTNNATLVSTITNLAPTKARGISLTDPIRQCNWYQAVTNGVFFWNVED